MDPTRESVIAGMSLFKSIGEEAFLKKFSSGYPPKAHYVLHHGMLFPLKALWAASYQPPIHTSSFNTADARRGLRSLGFQDFLQGDLAQQFEEGGRHNAEIVMISRSRRIAQLAKKKFGLKCQACGFDFEKFYGSLGAGYIECHHKEPLSGREGVGKPTKIEELAVLCANCHRMIHRTRKALTLEELTSKIIKIRRKTSN